MNVAVRPHPLRLELDAILTWIDLDDRKGLPRSPRVVMNDDGDRDYVPHAAGGVEILRELNTSGPSTSAQIAQRLYSKEGDVERLLMHMRLTGRVAKLNLGDGVYGAFWDAA